MRSGSFQNSGIEKAFLFDVVSKIYIATDSSPVDMQSYELCCDMIDVVIDISCIYGWVHLLVTVSIFKSMIITGRNKVVAKVMFLLVSVILLTPQEDDYCCGRYASYWNAFLFHVMHLYYFCFFLYFKHIALLLQHVNLQLNTLISLVISTKEIVHYTICKFSPQNWLL